MLNPAPSLRNLVATCRGLTPGQQIGHFGALIDAGDGTWNLDGRPGQPVPALVEINMYGMYAHGLSAEDAVRAFLRMSEAAIYAHDASGTDAVQGDLGIVLAQLLAISMQRDVPLSEVYTQICETLIATLAAADRVATLRLLEYMSGTTDGRACNELRVMRDQALLDIDVAIGRRRRKSPEAA